jgi:signal peptidase II
MRTANKIFVLVTMLIACIAFDQTTKRLATLALKGQEPLVYLGDTFRLEYAENPGAFLGMGGTLPEWERWALLTVASSVVLVLLTIFVCVRKDLRAGDILGYALILSGGISNMIDRTIAGVVVDFMNMGFGPLRTGIFNVADVAIMAGLFTVVAAHFAGSAPRPQTPQTSGEAKDAAA